MQASEAPDQALQLVGMLTSHWHSAALPNAWPAQLLTAGSSAAAVQCLPYTLPALLQRPAWQHSVKAVAHSLTRILAQLNGEASRRSACVQTAAACVLALRDSLPDDAWEHLPVAIRVLSSDSHS